MGLRVRVLVLVAGIGIWAVLHGCIGRSPAPRFYTLTPPETGRAEKPSAMATTVAIGPVTIPEYLNRRQIVTRRGEHVLAPAELDRWGGTLEEEITGALVAEAAHRLHGRRVAVFPFNSKLLHSADAVTRVPVTIARLDLELGGKVVLVALWRLTGTGDDAPDRQRTRQATVSEESHDKSYDAIAAALGKAVATLADRIADDVVASMPEQEGE